MALVTCTGDAYVEYIDKTECIGNSLEKINSNFQILDSALCEVSTLFDVFSQLSGIPWSQADGSFRAAVKGTNGDADYYKPGDSLDGLTITGEGVVGGNLTVVKSLNVLDIIRCTGDVVAFSSSDERLKSEIETITNPLEKLAQIRGVTYNWDTEKQDTYQGADVGVLAQEVEKVQPECVVERTNGFKAVRYEKLIPLLIEAVKELREQNIVLTERINNLTN